ncbi:MAG: hypothetical protein CMQ19_11795 [Gammaproteobacteria bacterium]|nr:hypothetical protein [Gammaproteobacteria bacterium]|tara:strand:- start:584 stop:1156 length:573 start_codon:yes stop_codon:yes gene_type:complete
MDFQIRQFSLAGACAVLLLVILFSSGNDAIGNEPKLSERYAMEIDSASKEKLGDSTYSAIMTFFHDAEVAIETKNIDALMDLYSENYTDGTHDKGSAYEIWTRIFSTFEFMATHHNMKLVSVTNGKNVVVFRCSGLLLGAPNVEKGVITIDNWNQQDHVLTLEDGNWKLLGTYGQERKRLWFDKPMHPLF